MNEEEEAEDEDIDDADDHDCCHLCAERSCGLLGFSMNLLILAALGWGICRVQSSLSVAETEGHDFGTADYVVVLAAGCPRCAFLSSRALQFDAQAALFDRVNQTSPIAPLQNVSKNVGFWALWVAAPSVEAVQYILPLYRAYPALTTSFIGLMVLTFVQDSIYFLLMVGHLCKRNLCTACSLLIAYILRNAALWGYAELYFLLYYSFYFQGARLFFFIFTLVFIIAMKATSVCIGVVAFLGLCSTESNEEVTFSLCTAMCGTLVALPACLCCGASIPFATGPLLCYLPLALFIYTWIMLMCTRAPGVCLLANILVVEQLMDRGVANILLLETLRHKTSLWRYFAIRLCGGLACVGGSEGGSTASIGMADDTEGKFYVFKDTFFGQTEDCTKDTLDTADGASLAQTCCDPLKWVLPNIHAWLAARNAACYLLSCTHYQDLFDRLDGLNCCAKLMVALVSNVWGIVVIMLPSIKFRCTLNDLAEQPFFNDPAYGGAAWFTYNDVPAWWIGPSGTLCQTILSLTSCTLVSEARLAPTRAGAKLASGLFQLACAALWLIAVDVWRNPLAIMMLQWL